MLQNAYFLAKIGADTTENEQHFAEFLPKFRRMEVRPHRTSAPALRRRRGVRRGLLGRAREEARQGHGPHRTFLLAAVVFCGKFQPIAGSQCILQK